MNKNTLTNEIYYEIIEKRHSWSSTMLRNASTQEDTGYEY